MMMNRPVIRSVTSDCAPKPMARPMTPAPASSGVTFMPMLASATMMAITAMVAMMVLRISGSMVSARTLARFLPPVPRACCKAVSVRIQISQATSMVPTKLAARGPMRTAALHQAGQRHAQHAQADFHEQQQVGDVEQGVAEIPELPR